MNRPIASNPILSLRKQRQRAVIYCITQIVRKWDLNPGQSCKVCFTILPKGMSVPSAFQSHFWESSSRKCF